MQNKLDEIKNILMGIQYCPQFDGMDENEPGDFRSLLLQKIESLRLELKTEKDKLLIELGLVLYEYYETGDYETFRNKKVKLCNKLNSLEG